MVKSNFPDGCTVRIYGMVLVGPVSLMVDYIAHIHTRVSPMDDHTGIIVFNDSGKRVPVLFVTHVFRTTMKTKDLRALIGHPSIVVGHPVG